MKRLWHRVLGWMTPGIRMVLSLMCAACLVTLIGTFSGLYDLHHLLALNGPDFWSGQVWRIITYVVLPVSFLSFVMNAVIIAILGRSLERMWSRQELWLYCIVVIWGTGLAKVLIHFSLLSSLAGAAPLAFGLLVAWGFAARHEKASLGSGGDVTVGIVALLAGVTSIATAVYSAGPGSALIRPLLDDNCPIARSRMWSAGKAGRRECIRCNARPEFQRCMRPQAARDTGQLSSRSGLMLSGGLTGLLYLWLKERAIMGRASRVVQSERIRRLEI